MATLGQIRNRVGRKIQNPNFTGDLSASVVEEEINRSIRFYEKYRFFFNEDLASITLNADDKVVPSIPSDISSPLYVNGLMLIDSDVKITLEKLSPTDFLIEITIKQEGHTSIRLEMVSFLYCQCLKRITL